MKQRTTWRNASSVIQPLLPYISLLPLLLFVVILLSGCHVHTHAHVHQIIMVPVDDVTDLCFPERGSDQSVDVRLQGHAFDSAQTGCI